jgi:hypothetical protein
VGLETLQVLELVLKAVQRKRGRSRDNTDKSLLKLKKLKLKRPSICLTQMDQELLI